MKYHDIDFHGNEKKEFFSLWVTVTVDMFS
jgi:hypothetical protein